MSVVPRPSVSPLVRHPDYQAGCEIFPYKFKAHNGHQGTDPTVSQADELAAGPYHVVPTGHSDLVVIRWSCESTEPSGGKTRTAQRAGATAPRRRNYDPEQVDYVA